MMTLNNTVYATGEGTPLVLVHAFPVDHRMWDDCAEQIARQARERVMAQHPVLNVMVHLDPCEAQGLTKAV